MSLSFTIIGNVVLAALAVGFFIALRKSKRRLAIVVVMVGLGWIINVATLVIASSSSSAPSWFTPYAPAIDTQAQWQIQGYHSDEDSASRFVLAVGVGTTKSHDYSFWLDKLSWKQIRSSDLQAMFGKNATLLISNKNSVANPVFYDLAIPNTIDTNMTATRVGYGQGNPENLVDSVVSLQKGTTLHLIFVANRPTQWVGTSTDMQNQTVTFTFR